MVYTAGRWQASRVASYLNTCHRDMHNVHRYAVNWDHTPRGEGHGGGFVLVIPRS